MKLKLLSIGVAVMQFMSLTTYAQPNQSIIEDIIKEANNNSQLETLAMELLDDIGPRLIGSPQYTQANNWIIDKYKHWGIQAHNEAYGLWKSWERGITRVEMTSPRWQELSAIQLAWSPSTPGNKPIEASIVALAIVEDSVDFKFWLRSIKGKIVLISKPELTGRPEDSWKRNALPEDYNQYVSDRKASQEAWNKNLEKMGVNARTLPAVLEKAGAVGLISSSWSGGWGANRIFAARTQKIPNVDVSLEHYNMLWRMAQRGVEPSIKMLTTSQDFGMKPVHNTIGIIKGSTHPEEYVLLSAHLDSWDGSQGATDNGTGTIVMMEVMRILKKVYPNPKRTIIVGHWGGEEQGINGSAAYVEDHPEMWDKISVVFNQDNGTGRINHINGLGFLDAYEYFQRWMNYLPEVNRSEIKTTFPGSTHRANSDYAPFVARGIPAFFLIGNDWDYGTYTWHTNIDSYDKIVFSDVRKNAETIAILTYLACEEPAMMSRRRAEMPVKLNSTDRYEWLKPLKPNRDGKY